MDALLQFVPEPLRATVRNTGERIARADAGWCRALLGRSGDVLGPNVARTVAAVAPTLPYQDVRLLTRFSLWLYLLDDQLDDSANDSAALHELQRDIERVLDGQAPPEADQLLLTLATQLAELTARSPWNRVRALLVRTLRECLAAGVEHAVLSRDVQRGRAPAPSVEDYLELAARHINYRLFGLALVLLVAESCSAADQRRIERALASGSLAVRLANDLCSVERERSEGTLNTLALRIHDLAPVREASVRQRIRQAVGAHDGELVGLPEPIRAALANSLRVSVAVYGIGDLR